jgi:hypothetical protein
MVDRSVDNLEIMNAPFSAAQRCFSHVAQAPLPGLDYQT